MCNKECFKKREAEHALNRVKKSSKQYRKECRMYYCDKCNAWHLTSKETNEPKEFKILEKDRWLKLLNNEVYEENL
jgi:hypothetical protein